MPRPWTPTAPRESHLSDSSVLASVTLTTSPTAFLLITVLTWLQGGASPLWPMWFSVYASRVLLCSRLPQLFKKKNAACTAPPDAQHSIGMAG